MSNKSEIGRRVRYQGEGVVHMEEGADACLSISGKKPFQRSVTFTFSDLFFLSGFLYPEVGGGVGLRSKVRGN